MGAFVVTIQTARKGLDAFKEGKEAFKAGDTLAGLASMTSGILGIASAAITAGKAIAAMFDRNKGRDLVSSFAAQMGGFDTLHARLLELGDDGEQLWIRLTQGVGRNNPDQAKAAIDAINAALGQQTDRIANAEAVMKEYGFSFEDAGAKWRAANLGAQFDALYQKTLTLRDVGIDYDEILRRQAGEYSTLVQRAVSTNTEIDSSMRPVLQRLVDMGLLTDENGEKFSDLGDVSWTTTLTEATKGITKAIYDLRDAILGTSSAFDDLGRKRISIPIGTTSDTGSTATPSAASWGMEQTITVQVGEDVIARAAARGLPSELTVNGI